jgi:Fe-S cluster assembly protein SufD
LTHATSEVLGREAVEAFARQRSEPDWLRAARLAAWERYLALPKPTLQDFGWRRTDIRALDLDRLAAQVGSDGSGSTLAELDATIDESAMRAGLLVLHNGAVVRRELDEALAGRGVLLMSLSEAATERPELVRDQFDRERTGGAVETKFDALAGALWNDGVLVYVPRGVEVPAPIQLVRWNDGVAPALSQTLVIAEEASSVALIDGYGAPAGRPESLGCGEISVLAKPAARVSVAVLQERDLRSWNFVGLRSEQGRDSAVTWLMLGLGGKLSRTELTCDLNGQGSEADLIGLVLGHQDQMFDLQSLQNHVGDDSRSDLVLKVALRDGAASNFTGMIRVGKSARRTSSNQENRNLLLSGQARADSDPKLEILNSDVTRCGHGATVGPVDEELIFYLMTRGLTRQRAERLVVEGFFEPVLASVPLESVRDRLRASIERKLELKSDG